MSERLIEELEKWLIGRGYKAFHEKPLDADAAHLSFWTKSNKHKSFTVRDTDFLRCYALFSLAAAAPFSARGIEVRGRGFVRPDVAVMNSCINAGFVVLQNGFFRITYDALKHLELAIPE